MVESINIVELAFGVAAAVEKFLTKAKRFFYMVMLFGCRCSKCKGSLFMVAEGKCRCTLCKFEFDPTIEFQRCLNCGGIAVLRVRRYQCKKCGSDITSKFLFDGIVFDIVYYRRKMAESRQRKKEQKQRVQEMLAQCRSDPLALETPDLGSVSGLLEALNSLTSGLDPSVALELRDKFDLSRYQSHIRSHLGTEAIDLKQIPPLVEDLRRDLIWKFIAAIFLDHAGLVNICQQHDTIWVMKFDDREGQGISGKAEEIDGFERPECAVGSW